MGSRLRAGAAVVAASLFAATAAHADPTAADRETARTLMQQGRELRQSGNLAEALKRFKAADDIMHVPTTGLEVARAQIALGQLVEARDTIAAIRQWQERASDPAPFREARVKALELDGSLNGRVPSLTVTVKGAGENETAAVTIDGVALPEKAAGLPRSVDPGHHVVVAKTPSGEGKAEVDLAEGEQKKLEVTLVVTAPPPQEPPQAPPEPEAPPPPARSHAPTTLTWIGAGVGGAGLVTGAVAGFMSMSKKSSIDGACANKVCGPSAYSDLDSANLLAMVSNIGFAVAGAGAALAVVTLIVGHEAPSDAPAAAEPPAEKPAEKPAEQGIRWAPWIGAGAAGVRGTF